MCGIAGIFSYSASAGSLGKVAESAVAELNRRGPDSHGIFREENVCLAHTRLSIIDTSISASQPFFDSSGRYVLVYNGEFFNFQEHKKALEQKGVEFRSGSDTEVLLHLLIRFREKALGLINGFFSFAFYDKEMGELLLARDRYGEKPLYYFADAGKFCFASEIKALRSFGIPVEPDLASLRLFFHLHYIPQPWTAFEGVRKLEPGSYVKISRNETIFESFYELGEASEEIKDYGLACRQLSTVLEDAVKLRMISDVPLGCFLSGGIDSSIIAALASRYTTKLKTFSIGFSDEPYFDETKYAALVAKKYGTDHTAFSLKSADLLEVLDDVLQYPDEPFADSSALAVYILSRETRKHVTVALSGDGADELFAGYNKHAAELKALSSSRLKSISKLALPVLEALPASRNSFAGNKIRQARKFAAGLQLSAGERYWQWAGFGNDDSNHIEELLEYVRRKRELTSMIDQTDFNTVLKADMRLVLEGDMLVKVDRMSMANSLEVRPPFLDHRVVDLAFSMPSSFKIEGNSRKKILRDTFGSLLPPELLNRPKQGFEVPLLKWFRNELRGRLEKDVFDEKKIRGQGILDPEKVLAIRKQLYSSNPGDAAARTYALLAFQTWYKKHFS